MNLQHLTFAIPGDLATLTGGYGYDRRLIAALRDMGIRVDHVELPSNFPMPDADDVETTLRRLAPFQNSPLLIDALAYSALSAAAIAHLPRPLIVLVHHPLGLETGLSPPIAQKLLVIERAALALCDHIFVTSATTAQCLVADFAVADQKLTMAEPGTDKVARAIGSNRAAELGPRLMAVGSVVPRKGYDVLVEALKKLRDLPWHLDIAGSLNRDPETALKLKAQIAAAGLMHKITLLGEFTAGHLQDAYHRTDIFVMSSHYEGYGMVIAEAMACGLPIVTTTGGALARTLPDGAGLKVAPGDVSVLAQALEKMITDAPFRATMAEASWRAGQALPRWPDVAALVAATIAKVKST